MKHLKTWQNEIVLHSNEIKKRVQQLPQARTINQSAAGFIFQYYRLYMYIIHTHRHLDMHTCQYIHISATSHSYRTR